MSGFIYGRNPNADTLDGLDSAAFAILAGQAGGQTLQGGTAANEDLTLEGTAHSTKTSSYVILQPTAGNVGINTTTPATPLHVVGAATITGGIRPAADGTTALTLCKANGTAVVTVDTTNGYLGVGVTPGVPAHIKGVLRLESVASGANIVQMYASGDYVTYDAYGDAANTGAHRFRVNDATVEALFLAPDGSVGLGTVAPATKLDIGAGAMTLLEMTAPGAGAANTARIYAKDNGAGKTQLMVQFATGGEIQIAIEA